MLREMAEQKMRQNAKANRHRNGNGREKENGRNELEEVEEAEDGDGRDDEGGKRRREERFFYFWDIFISLFKILEIYLFICSHTTSNIIFCRVKKNIRINEFVSCKQREKLLLLATSELVILSVLVGSLPFQCISHNIVLFYLPLHCVVTFSYPLYFYQQIILTLFRNSYILWGQKL